ncbi:DUF3885 domain-containing protein [Simiduia agarivorans]|uniref:DUF3885 domain-containing protein n=1 Tax=Simiduia agarivorans TaxID=447471 RepID=UPI000462813D|nr:DUF3885 domain-containing protein [Simiduia agarivorans]
MRAIDRRAGIKERAGISTVVSFFVPVARANSLGMRHSALWCATKQVHSWVKYCILAPLVALRCSIYPVGWANRQANNKQKQPTRKKRARLFRALYSQRSICSMKFERPIFYNNPIGLRFEIGPEDISLWKSYENRVLNDNYFNEALARAVRVFDFAFDANDSISVIYQIYSDGRRKIRKGNFLFKQIIDVKSRLIAYSDHRDIYTDTLDFKSYCWKRVRVSGMKTKDLDKRNLLEALINTDFSSRGPSLRGECFFINHSKDLVLNLYDDRGMDVVAKDKEVLIPLYERCSDIILDYDRERIDSVFKRI